MLFTKRTVLEELIFFTSKPWDKKETEHSPKGLSLYHKLKFSNPFNFAT